MKKIVLILALFTATYLQAQNVNEKVQVESSGVWYEGTILKVDRDKGEFYVHYESWGDGSDEWVTPDRIKKYEKMPLAKFKVGDKVEVEYGMVPEPATIIEVGENKYHIKYEKSLLGDKWVSEGKIKKL